MICGASIVAQHEGLLQEEQACEVGYGKFLEGHDRDVDGQDRGGGSNKVLGKFAKGVGRAKGRGKDAGKAKGAGKGKDKNPKKKHYRVGSQFSTTLPHQGSCLMCGRWNSKKGFCGAENKCPQWGAHKCNYVVNERGDVCNSASHGYFNHPSY